MTSFDYIPSHRNWTAKEYEEQHQRDRIKIRNYKTQIRSLQKAYDRERYFSGNEHSRFRRMKEIYDTHLKQIQDENVKLKEALKEATMSGVAKWIRDLFK